MKSEKEIKVKLSRVCEIIYKSKFMTNQNL